MTVIYQHFTVTYSFPIIFTRDVFNNDNPSLSDVLQNSGEKRNRILIAIDSGVAQADTMLVAKITDYVTHYSDIVELVDFPCLIIGGERCKQDSTEVQKIHILVDRHHLCRHSFIIAIGGGSVLDVVGYASATAHRGVRLIRIPTTTLAQNDAGVGVKNGINAHGRKNFLGTFAPPFAVINDFDFLKTLPERDMRSGIAEAVKVALIKDKEFFEYLYRERKKLAKFVPEVMEKMIVRCAELHIEHIGKNGDPFEYGSSRPLDFGHWSAHKMEEMSCGNIKHGEAVAIGIALDSLYSHNIGLIDMCELNDIFTTLEDIGFSLYHQSLCQMNCSSALREFQEHLGGKLTITLLKGIGNKIDIHEMDVSLLKRCIDMLSARKLATEI